jgi:hypothetical protein
MLLTGLALSEDEWRLLDLIEGRERTRPRM